MRYPPFVKFMPIEQSYISTFLYGLQYNEMLLVRIAASNKEIATKTQKPCGFLALYILAIYTAGEIGILKKKVIGTSANF